MEKKSLLIDDIMLIIRANALHHNGLIEKSRLGLKG